MNIIPTYYTQFWEQNMPLLNWGINEPFVPVKDNFKP